MEIVGSILRFLVPSSCLRLRRTKIRFLRSVVLLATACCLLCFFLWSSASSRINVAEEIAVKQIIFDLVGNDKVALRVLPDVSTVLLQPDPKYCKNNGTEIYTLFMVISTPTNRRVRNNIRRGLKRYINNHRGKGNEDGKTNTMLFFVGASHMDTKLKTQLETEASDYGDLVIDNMFESYHNLPLKTLRMFKWVRHHCDRAEFVVKIDDDVHLNLAKFFSILSPLSGTAEGKDLIGGHLYENSIPSRDPGSKWYTPPELWPLDEFPNFVAGFFYVLGQGALEQIYFASLDVPMFHLEDVFITGIIGSHTLQMELTGFEGISKAWVPYSNWYTSSCTVQEKYLAIHFYFKTWNYLNCWHVFNSEDFVCNHFPFVINSYC